MLYEDSGYGNNNSTLQILPTENESLKVSHKTLLEGISFDLTYNPLMHLGYKAVLSSLGNLYASLHKPVALSVNIGLSGRFFYEDVEKIWQGVVAASRKHGIESLILDLDSSLTGLSISVASVGKQVLTAFNQQKEPKEHDLICLSGDIGAAYMGLLILEREKVAFNRDNSISEKMKQPDLSQYKYILESYLSPYINPDLIEQFLSEEIIPGKGYFIRNGLASAIKELSSESGLGARIYLERVPIASKTIEAGEEFGIDAVTAAMNGGDDFKFLFTIPIEKHEKFGREFQNWDIIGHLTKPGASDVLVTPDGTEVGIKAQGWN